MYKIVDLTTDQDLAENIDTQEAALLYTDTLADDIPWGVYSAAQGEYVAIVFDAQVWRPS